MKKTILLISIVVISIVAVYALILYTKMDSLSFAWALNFLLMLCVSIFIETQKSQLTSYYFNVKKWEKRGKIYEHIGINLFRKLLVLIGWEKLNKKNNPVEKDIQKLESLHFQTKKSELGHFIILIIVLGFNVFVLFKFGFLKSLWLLVLNILLNLYPILLQRYNRPRIERVIAINKRR